MLAARKRRIQTKLGELDEVLAELDAGASGAEAVSSSAAVGGGTDVMVTIGTSQLFKEDPSIVSKIEAVVNGAYTHSMADEIAPGQVYRRVSRGDVINRLEMGDAGLRANRVLHLAWRGAELVGACSSTYQPPWCSPGCGHWGLLSVLPTAQGSGVASALVRAAEERLAGVCSMIQIEYEYTPAHDYSERLFQWYEGKCGFACRSGAPRPCVGAQFRKCFKTIPDELKQVGRVQRLRALRAQVAAELAEAEAEEVARPQDGGDAQALVGKRVLLSGLRTGKHNGRRGSVVSYAEGRGRYAVQCEAAEGRVAELLLLKAENLELEEESDDDKEESEEEEEAGSEDEEGEEDQAMEEEEEDEEDEEACVKGEEEQEDQAMEEEEEEKAAGVKKGEEGAACVKRCTRPLPNSE